jgi:hypothetical protein
VPTEEPTPTWGDKFEAVDPANIAGCSKAWEDVTISVVSAKTAALLLRHGGNKAFLLQPEGPGMMAVGDAPLEAEDVAALKAKWKVIFADEATWENRCNAPPMAIHTEGAPVFQGSAPFTDPIKRAVLREKLQSLLQRGLVEKGVSAWSARPLLVWEARKNKWRLVIDYRGLNSKTVCAPAVMPNHDEVWTSLAGMRVFSGLDLSESFYQYTLAPEDRAKTAFRVEQGQYQWRVVPFGLRGAPGHIQSQFEAVIEEVKERLRTRGLKGVAALWIWMDDLLVATKDRATHLMVLDLLFEVCAEHNLHFKESKCELAKEKIVWVGFEISAQGRRVAATRMEVGDFKIPRTAKDIQRLTGWAQWSGQGVPGLSSLLRPGKAEEDAVRGTPVVGLSQAGGAVQAVDRRL